MLPPDGPPRHVSGRAWLREREKDGTSRLRQDLQEVENYLSRSAWDFKKVGATFGADGTFSSSTVPTGDCLEDDPRGVGDGDPDSQAGSSSAGAGESVVGVDLLLSSHKNPAGCPLRTTVRLILLTESSTNVEVEC